MSPERFVKDVFGLYILCNGGADGIRTHDLLDAIEARSQLRHGPTEGMPQVYHRPRESVLPTLLMPTSWPTKHA
jgi:hypothetical protein